MNKIRHFYTTTEFFIVLYETFVHNPQFIYKIQFSSNKTSRSASRRIWSVSNVIMRTSYWQVHRDLIFVFNMPWRINPAFTMHATVSYLHFLRSSTFLHIWNLFIESFSQLVELLFLCDVTDTIIQKSRPRLLFACLNSAASGWNLSSSSGDEEFFMNFC